MLVFAGGVADGSKGLVAVAGAVEGVGVGNGEMGVSVGGMSVAVGEIDGRVGGSGAGVGIVVGGTDLGGVGSPGMAVDGLHPTKNTAINVASITGDNNLQRIFPLL